MTRRYKRKKGHRKVQTWEEGSHLVSEYRWDTKPLTNGEKKRKKKNRRTKVNDTGRFL